MIQYIIYRLTCFQGINIGYVCQCFPTPCHENTLTYLYINHLRQILNSPKRITTKFGWGALKIRAPPMNKGVSDEFKNFEKFTLCSKTR